MSYPKKACAEFLFEKDCVKKERQRVAARCRSLPLKQQIEPKSTTHAALGGIRRFTRRWLGWFPLPAGSRA